MSLPSLLDADPFLWEVMDSYFSTLFENWKEQWLETAAATVVVAEQFNPDAATFPIIVILSYEREDGDEPPPFGDGEYHMAGMTYNYEFVVCISMPTVFDAKRVASAAGASLLDAIRSDFENLVALNATNGEVVQRFEFGEMEIYVRGLAGQPEEGKYTGCARIELTVYTEI